MEEGAGERLDRAREVGGAGEGGVQAEDGDVLLACVCARARGSEEGSKRAGEDMDVPAPCCDLTSRVARSMQTMRHPVTLGSSVPL